MAGRSDFYTPGDQFHLAGDWRLYLFQERTHGLGSGSTTDVAADVDYDWFRFHQVGYFTSNQLGRIKADQTGRGIVRQQNFFVVDNDYFR